jgi:hypothetical protein
MLDSFVEIAAILGKADPTRLQLQCDRASAAPTGSSRASVERMLEPFLLVDQFGVVRIGAAAVRVAPGHAVLHRTARGFGAPVRGPVDRPAEDDRTLPGGRKMHDHDGTPLDLIPLGEAAD